MRSFYWSVNMNIKSTSSSRTFPKRLYCQPACTLEFPFNTEVSDAWSVSGSGIGRGSHSLKTALGEYYERKHFYTDITPEALGTLNYSLSVDEAAHFAHAFAQTSFPSRPHNALLNHTFHLTKVIRTSDFTDCHIPTACLSLNHYDLGEDNSIYPLKDTCGCSFHWDANKTIFSALKECLERQFLTRFWLTGQHTERMESPLIISALRASDTLPLATTLSKTGELVAFDISDPLFPGTCIIVFYGQKKSAHHVKYCTGMAYSMTQKHGLEKAVAELWQTFRFMDLFIGCNGNTNALKDPYLRHFFDCNTYLTFTAATTSQKRTIHIKKNERPFNTNCLLEALNKQKIQGYFYLKASHIDSKKCLFCKFISPQLFMHMDNSKHINLHNHHSSIFKEKILPARQKIMVPFP